MKIATIGTYPPRQCGIATFTHDLYCAMNKASHQRHGIIAISNETEEVFPEEVVFIIRGQLEDDYVRAAHFINTHYDVCVIQHEYGIFGGEAGRYILDLMILLKVPVITNLHTILQRPVKEQYEVTQQLLKYSTHITVMTDRAIYMLMDVYGLDKAKVTKIPHGTPEFSYDQNKAKRTLGLQGKRIMLSFGFLGQNKGFETAIDAVVRIGRSDFIYIILGQTHPNIKKIEGEAYRESLIGRAKALGVIDRVKFVDVFATEELLVQYLTACDIYVSPYPNKAQISSGTLAFAMGAGAAIISTPYWYAQDLLAEGRGLLFDFLDAGKLGAMIDILLSNASLLRHYRERSRAYGEQLAWSKVGNRHLALLTSLHAWHRETTQSIPLETDVSKARIAPIFSVRNNRLSS